MVVETSNCVLSYTTEQLTLQSTLDSTWPPLSPFHIPPSLLFLLSYFSIVTIGLRMHELWIGESHELAFDTNGPRLVWCLLWFATATAADDDTDTDTGALYLWICT